MAEDEFIQLSPGTPIEEDVADPELVALLKNRLATRNLAPVSALSDTDWDAPFDLRVMRPRAIDLRKLWQLIGHPEPPGITATLGPRRPILLNHVVTPFPVDGRIPGGVWGLGYEFIPHGIDASTVSVAPENEVFTLGKVGQDLNLSLDLGGRITVPRVPLEAGPGLPVALTGAGLQASTRQSFQFALQLHITLRKVIGAAVGVGGAQWKIYRQDEPIDQSHTLLQTLLVPESTRSLHCTIKTWARQAGVFGTRWRSRFWTYADQTYDISLAGP